VLLLSCIQETLLFALPIKIYDTELEVEKFEKVDSENVAVNVHGKEVLIREADLKKFLIKEHFCYFCEKSENGLNSKERGIYSVSQFEKLISGSAQEGDTESLYYILIAFLSDKKFNDTLKVDTLSKLISVVLPDTSKKQEVFNLEEKSPTDKDVSHIDLIARVSNFDGIEKSDEFSLRIRFELIYSTLILNQIYNYKTVCSYTCNKFIYEHSDYVKESLVQKFNSLVESRQFLLAQKTAEVVTAIFPTDTSQRIKDLVLDSFFLSRISVRGSSIDINEVKSILLFYGTKKSVITPLCFEVLNSQAKQLLEKHEYIQALLDYTHIPLSNKTPESHEIVMKSLELAHAAGGYDIEKDITGNTGFLKAMREFSETDTLIKEKYVEFMSMKIKALLSEKMATEAESLFQELQNIKEQRSQRLDTLRLAFAWYYTKNGPSGLAVDKLNEVIPHAGMLKLVLLSLWIVFLGLTKFSLFLILVFFVSTFYVFLKRLFGKKPEAQVSEKHKAYNTKEKVTTGNRNKTEEVNTAKNTGSSSSLKEEFKESTKQSQKWDDDEHESTFVKRVSRGSTELIEFYESLAQLGLGPTPTVKEVKSAYREAIKKYHPDRIKGDVVEKNKIISIKESYEKILKYLKEHPDALQEG
jgi:DnaJ-domain-containing protein 1